MDAATAKRKRPATNGSDDASAPASASAAPKAAVTEEVSDAEVEEFYAILRRMRDASRRLCGARPPARAPAWRPSFSWEDFAAVPAAPARRPRPDLTDDDDTAAPPPPPPSRAGGLDLNVEPEPDEPSFSASAPATPRSARAPA